MLATWAGLGNILPTCAGLGNTLPPTGADLCFGFALVFAVALVRLGRPVRFIAPSEYIHDVAMLLLFVACGCCGVAGVDDACSVAAPAWSCEAFGRAYRLRVVFARNKADGSGG